MSIYKYHLAGYVFETNIYLPELTKAKDDAICTLMYCKEAPAGILQQPEVHSYCYNVELGIACLYKKANGSVFIKNNKQLDYVPPSYFNKTNIRQSVLGTVGLIMSASQGYTAFHGACVIINGKAVLFCGKSGSGKSSIAAWFYYHKYTILSDDVTYINESDNVVTAYASVPRIKLSAQVLQLFNKNPTGLQQVEGPKLKYALSIATSSAPNGHKVSAIVFLDFENNKLELKSVNGGLKAEKLFYNLHRKKDAVFISSAKHLNMLTSNICAKVPMYSFVRPDSVSSFHESFIFIEKCLHGLI
jgi:hypothetical protein